MKLEIIIRGKAGKFTSLWKLTSLFNNQQIKEEIAGEIRKYFKPNENEHTPDENQWDPVKPVLRGTFLAVNAYLTKNLKSPT